jgi:hypothetical protein
MQGISPRYIQDKISNALVSHQAQLEKAINPFMVMNELEGGLSHHSLITDEELKKEYKELLAVVREEYEDIIKGEVQKAISADEDAIRRLAANYIESVRAYTQHERVRNRYTMILKIEKDHQRFRQIVKGRIRDDLRKFLTKGELIGKEGKHLISIPVRGIELPHFRYGDNSGGVGAGDGKEGDTSAKANPAAGKGQGGTEPASTSWKWI